MLQAASQGRRDVALATFEAAKGHWAVETGLGPLLAHTTADDPQAKASRLWPAVQGADLLSRMLTAEQFAAMDEILDACDGRMPPVTLLKGISIADQHYPLPHLRPMRDLDILVEATDLPTIESVLHTLGYHQQSSIPPAFYHTHHHLMPFVHPRRGIWVEVHRQLFPPHSRLGADPVFRLDHLTTQLQGSTFRGRPVKRLSDALQLVYIACHWADDLPGLGGMLAMLDLIYLLHNTRHDPCWERLLDWLRGSVAAAPVYLLLSYLVRDHLIAIPPDTLRELSRRQHAFGPLNLHLMHALLDRFVVDGHPHGRVYSPYHLDIIWKTLLQSGRPWENLLRASWNLFRGSRMGAGLLGPQPQIENGKPLDGR